MSDYEKSRWVAASSWRDHYLSARCGSLLVSTEASPNLASISTWGNASEVPVDVAHASCPRTSSLTGALSVGRRPLGPASGAAGPHMRLHEVDRSQRVFERSLEAGRCAGLDGEVAAAFEEDELGWDSRHLVEQGSAHVERCPAVVAGMREHNRARLLGGRLVSGVVVEP